MRHGIEVTGTYEEIKRFCNEVIDFAERQMSVMDAEDASKAVFSYENAYRRMYSVEIPRDEEK